MFSPTARTAAGRAEGRPKLLFSVSKLPFPGRFNRVICGPGFQEDFLSNLEKVQWPTVRTFFLFYCYSFLNTSCWSLLIYSCAAKKKNEKMKMDLPRVTLLVISHRAPVIGLISLTAQVFRSQDRRTPSGSLLPCLNTGGCQRRWPFPDKFCWHYKPWMLLNFLFQQVETGRKLKISPEAASPTFSRPQNWRKFVLWPW